MEPSIFRERWFSGHFQKTSSRLYLRRSRNSCIRWRPGSCTERPGHLPVDHQLQTNMVVRQADQVFYEDLGIEFFPEDLRVGKAEPERDDGAHVSQGRVPDLRVELRE